MIWLLSKPSWWPHSNAEVIYISIESTEPTPGMDAGLEVLIVMRRFITSYRPGIDTDWILLLQQGEKLLAVS